jgi:tape measure domain-containing protein
VAQFGANISGFTAGIRSMSSQASTFAGHIGGISSRVGSSFVGMGRSILGAVSGVGKWLFFAKQGIQIAGGLASSFFAGNAALEQTQTAFKGILGSGTAASKMMKDLQSFAARTPFEMPQLVHASQQLLGVGLAARDVIPDLTAIGDTSARMGAGQEGIDQITLALTQMISKGKIGADDMAQMAETFPAWQVLAKAMGMSVAQVRDLSEQGKLGSDAINKLVAGMKEFGGGAMQAQAATFNGLLSSIKDNVRNAFVAFAGPAFETAKTGLAQLTALTDPDKNPGFQKFAVALGQDVGGAIRQVTAIVGPMVGWFAQLIQAAQAGDRAFRTFSPALGFARDIFGQIGEILRSVFTPSIQVAEGWFARIGASVQGVIPQGVQFSDVLLHISNMLASFNPGPLSDVLAQLTNTAFQIAGQYIENIRLNFLALQTILTTAVIPAFVQMWPTVQGVLAALAPLGPVLLSLVGSAFQLSGVIRDAVVVAFQVFAPMIATIVTNLGDLLIPVIRLMTPAFIDAAAQVRAFVGDLNVRLGPAIRGLGAIIGAFLSVVIVLWKALWPSLIPVLQGVWDIITGVVKIAWSIVSGIILVGLDILGGNWGQAWTDMKNMFAGIWDGIVSILRGTWGVLSGIFLGILAFLGRLWARIWGDVSKAWSGMWGEINDWVSRIWKSITDKAGDIFNGLMKPFRDFGAGVGGVLRGGINTVIDWINGAIDRIDDFVVAIATGIDTVSSALGAGDVISKARPIGHISRLASGTDFFAGGLAMVGEAGRELALLPRGTAVASHTETEAMVRSGLVPSPNRGPAGHIGGGIPGFAGGVGDVLGNIWGWISSGVTNLAGNLMKTVFTGMPTLPAGFFAKIGAGLLGKVGGWLSTWINKTLPAMGAGAANLPQAAYGEFILPHINAGWHVPLWYGLHQGIDFAFNQGSALRELIGGRVLGHTGWYPWGGELDVQLANGLWERYLHLSAIFAHAGDIVRRGQLVGLTGGGTPASGLGYWSGGSHLHLQYDTGGYQASVFPLNVLKAFHLFRPFMFKNGGMINEPIAGIGLRSGAPYSFGEGGPETVTPIGRGRRNDDEMLELLRTIAKAVTSQPISRYQLSQALGQVLTDHL